VHRLGLIIRLNKITFVFFGTFLQIISLGFHLRVKTVYSYVFLGGGGVAGHLPRPYIDSAPPPYLGSDYESLKFHFTFPAILPEFYFPFNIT